MVQLFIFVVASYGEHMNETQLNSLRNHLLVCAITRDHADIWLLNDTSAEPVFRITRIHEHQTHVRSAQEHHGHSTDIGEVPYFVEIARALALGSNVLLIGHGEGKANYVRRFMDHVSEHHAEVMKKVVAEETMNLPAMSSAQIVKEARLLWKSVVR